MLPKINLLGSFIVLVNLNFILCSEDEIDPYFEKYMDRKYVLLKPENSSDPNSLCFQSTFQIGNLDNSHYAFDIASEEDEKIYLERFNKKLLDRYPKPPIIGITCSSRFVEYFLNYKFPEGCEDGAEMDDADVKVLLQKKHFHLGYPETCQDVETFSKVFLRENEKKLFVTKLQELNDGKSYMITIEDCYPMIKMADFMKTYSEKKSKENYKKKDMNLRKYASIDNDKDYFGMYLDRRSVLLKPEESPVDKSLCVCSTFPLQSPTYMDYIFGKYGKEQLERESKWFDKKLRENTPTEFMELCPTNLVKYTLNYELPYGAINGTVEMNALDVKMMKQQRFYNENFPESCENPNLFLGALAVTGTQHFVRKMELRQNKKDYLVTLDTCYPINEINAEISPVSLPKKHQPNKLTLPDIHFLMKLNLIEMGLNEELAEKLGKQGKKMVDEDNEKKYRDEL